MKVKTFHALTMQDAIRAIKQELGPDAIILSSKEVQQGGRLLRLFNKPVLEVMAAAEAAAPDPMGMASPASQAPQPPAAAEPHPASSSSAFQQTLHSLLEPSAAPTTIQPPQAASSAATTRTTASWKTRRLHSLRRELEEIEALLGASLPPEAQSLGGRLSSEIAIRCRQLIAQGVRPSTAERLGRDLQARLDGIPTSRDTVDRELRALLSGHVRVSGPLLAGSGDRTVTLLLGPSGSGKTTAIAKLAAHYRLEEKRSVAVITFDTYRQCSVEQLRMYANVLGVPFASAVSPRQVHEGLRRHRQADVVLIDLPGAGSEDLTAARELQHLLREEGGSSVHLVIPASLREQDVFTLYHRVKEMSCLRVLFTKLDETLCLGTVFELAYQTGAPLSYWSAGQRVPEDLELAAPDRLAGCLVAGRYTPPPVGALASELNGLRSESVEA